MANRSGVQEIRPYLNLFVSSYYCLFDDDLGTYSPRQLIVKIKSASEKIRLVLEPEMGPLLLVSFYQYTLEVKP
jgi:cobalt-zinc-cadmium resistance protein CzcA